MRPAPASRLAFRLHYAADYEALSEDEEKALAYCLLGKKAAAAGGGVPAP